MKRIQLKITKYYATENILGMDNLEKLNQRGNLAILRRIIKKGCEN